MVEIVLFRPQQGQIRKSRANTQGTSARILFFTGVRYERFVEAKPPLAKGDSGAPPAGDLGGRRRRRRG